MKLNDSVTYLKGVGPKLAQMYEKLGVFDLYSLMQYYPRAYLDFTQPVDITQTIVGENNVIRARVYKKLAPQRIRKNLTVFKLYASDESGAIEITIFNSKYMFEAIKLDCEYVFYGKVTGSMLRRSMSSPMVIEVEQAQYLQAVYPLTEGITSKTIRKNMQTALDVLGDMAYDPIPDLVRKNYGLCYLRYAYENIHFPKDLHSLEVAKKRLVFEELLILSIALASLKSTHKAKTAIVLKKTDMEPFYSSLPFELTDAQKRCINESLQDMYTDVPMNRLVQGDVGSGKTMVAAGACYACAKSDFQSVMMAPTEILANQHYKTLCDVLEPLGIKVALLTGKMTAKQKSKVKEEIANGLAQVIVGTHALLQEDTVFARLGLVITDEQHRFGVAQRAILKEKGENPHVMVMSATPIPRTLAFIIYGDLDVSIVDQMPKGRQPIDTLIINSPKRERALGFIRDKLQSGQQAYIVCPLIEENEQLDMELKNVKDYAQKLSDSMFKDYNIGILHSKLKSADKEKIMQKFKDGQIHLLVSTTVVEVGVDVPNATVMLVENAERFGLSQLHQLRGRVGRGSEKSYCILLSDNTSEQNKQRLKILATSNDGFKISQEDLKMRGPGDFFGSRQHGLPELKIADISNDLEVLKQTQEVAKSILAKDPDLILSEHKGIRYLVKRKISDVTGC